MEYKHSCVIDAQSYYKTLVLVLLEPDGAGGTAENIQYYTLGEGERLLDGKPPTEFIRPHWNGSAWEEGATPEEIEQWEIDHPAPPPLEPSEIDLLRAELEEAKAQLAILTGGTE